MLIGKVAIEAGVARGGGQIGAEAGRDRRSRSKPRRARKR